MAARREDSLGRICEAGAASQPCVTGSAPRGLAPAGQCNDAILSAVDAFDRIGLPIAAIRRGRVLAASASFEALAPVLLEDRGERLGFADKALDVVWGRLLDADAAHRGATFPVRVSAAWPTVIAHAVPLAEAGQGAFDAADMLLILAPVPSRQPSDGRQLEGLFDLTASEAAIARELVLGRTIADIARLRGVSPNTVRSQVSMIFEKTGLHRQADLVRLLTGLDGGAPSARRSGRGGKRGP